jgi:hypothetical protein
MLLICLLLMKFMHQQLCQAEASWWRGWRLTRQAATPLQVNQRSQQGKLLCCWRIDDAGVALLLQKQVESLAHTSHCNLVDTLGMVLGVPVASQEFAQNLCGQMKLLLHSLSADMSAHHVVRNLLSQQAEAGSITCKQQKVLDLLRTVQVEVSIAACVRK